MTTSFSKLKFSVSLFVKKKEKIRFTGKNILQDVLLLDVKQL
jgi:hypothetical protein